MEGAMSGKVKKKSIEETAAKEVKVNEEREEYIMSLSVMVTSREEYVGRKWNLV